MKLIKPSFSILGQKSGLEGILSHIEVCGRISYKSEEKITNDSAPKFVDMLIKRGHGAVLEHGTVYLKFSSETDYPKWRKYTENKYSSHKWQFDDERTDILHSLDAPFNTFITTNYRVLIENNWLEDLKYQCEPTEYHEKRISVKFTIDRGVSHEFVRHRVFSFVQESTRFCNYSNNKFGNKLTFIIPSWVNESNLEWINERLYNMDILDYSSYIMSETDEEEFIDLDYFLYSLLVAEKSYLSLLNKDWLPQQARSILPNSLKTELIMTGTIDQWKGFFKLRCAKDAHPQAREMAIPLEEEFKNKKLI